MQLKIPSMTHIKHLTKLELKIKMFDSRKLDTLGK